MKERTIDDLYELMMKHEEKYAKDHERIFELGKVQNKILLELVNLNGRMDQRFKEQDAKIEEVKTGVKELKADVSTLKTEMKEIKTDVKELKIGVKTIKEEMDSSAKDIADALNGQVSEICNAIDKRTKQHCDINEIRITNLENLFKEKGLVLNEPKAKYNKDDKNE